MRRVSSLPHSFIARRIIYGEQGEDEEIVPKEAE
jgi:hypothetical protein